jgi:hypothetical protein
MIIYVLILLLLAGCGGSSGQGGNYPAPAASGVTLRVARVGNVDPLKAMTNVYRNGSWLGLTMQNANPSWSVAEVHAAMNSSGEVVLLMRGEDGMGGLRLYARVYSDVEGELNWSAPVEIGIGDYASVTMDAAGNALAVWSGGFLGNPWRPLFSRYDADTQLWGPVQVIDNNIEGDFIFQANNSKGDAFIVFRSSNGVTDDVFASRYMNGVWSPVVSVAEAVRHAIGATIAMNSNGDALAVWFQEQVDNSWAVYARRFSAATGTWGANKEFIGAAPGYQLLLDMVRATVAENGDLAVYWNGAGGQVLEARCSAAGAVWSQTVLAGVSEARTVPLASETLGVTKGEEFAPDGTIWTEIRSLPVQ